MKLIITGELPLEHQEIEISDTARIELCLNEYTRLRLRLLPECELTSAWRTVEVMASAAGLLLQPTSSNVMNYLLRPYPAGTKES